MHDGHDCDGGIGVIARVDTISESITSMAEGFSDTLRTSCELIRVFNALRQGAGSGCHMHFRLTAYMVEGRVIDLQIGRASSREARPGASAIVGVVPTRVNLSSCAAKLHGKR